MREIEIAEIPPLGPDEQSLLDMHSVLNLFNVLWGELTLIGLASENNPAALRGGLARIGELVQALRDPVESLRCAEHIEDHLRAFMTEIDAHLAARPDSRSQPEVANALANLASVFAVLRVRARELLARAGNPGLWVEMSAKALQTDFRTVFSAMEQASRGRFGIVYNAAQQKPTDYYIDLRFESSEGDRVLLPLLFKDVMRDLIANARKYTAPGGRITAALHATPERLRFVIQDTGRGIPPEELSSVVHYGRRGSNVTDVRTMGGGFGLTKAFFVTKQFGGRFWIASELGYGTRVRLEIPART